MATATKFRVYRINESLRKAVRAKREAQNVPTKAVLDAAVTEALPKIVKALQSVGFGMSKGKVRPVRWPVDSELLGALAVASKQVGGIPGSRLLAVALTLFCKGGK
jgi:hypothetical protein